MPYRFKSKLKHLSILGSMCLLLLIIETFTTPKKLLYQDVSSFSEYEKTLFQRIRTIDDAVKEVKAMSQKENTRRSLVVNAFILLSRISSNPMLVQKRCDGIIEDCSGERTARHTIRSNYILWFLGKFVDREMGVLKSSDKILNYSYYSSYRCSQQSIVLLQILSDLGFQVRWLELTGHVAIEVLVDGSWAYLDPHHNISPYVTDGIPGSLNQLLNINSKDNTPLINKYYRGFAYGGTGKTRGLPLEPIRPILFSTRDNVIVPHFRKDVLRYRYSRLEILADILKWCLPLLLLLSPAIHRTISNKFMA